MSLTFSLYLHVEIVAIKIGPHSRRIFLLLPVEAINQSLEI